MYNARGDNSWVFPELLASSASAYQKYKRGALDCKCCRIKQHKLVWYHDTASTNKSNLIWYPDATKINRHKSKQRLWAEDLIKKTHFEFLYIQMWDVSCTRSPFFSVNPKWRCKTSLNSFLVLLLYWYLFK